MILQFLFGTLISVIALCVLITEKPVDPHYQSPAGGIYDLQQVVAPVVSGTAQNVLSWVINAPFFGRVLATHLLNDNRLYLVRQFAASHPVAPVFYPLRVLSAEEVKQHSDAAASSSLALLDDLSITVNGFKLTTSRDYVKAYSAGITTPLEVAKTILKKIQESDLDDKPSLRAFVALDPESTLTAAEKSTLRYQSRSALLGPLDGVPFGVKCETDVIGFNTTLGTSFWGNYAGVSKSDAVAVDRMKKHGAIFMGVLNMHEIGIGTTGHNAHYGSARNPHNPAHYTGGSSSGSGSAVAAGLVPIAIGADGGGSIRVPAAFCGVVGLKPTFGRVPAVNLLDWTVGHVGPLGGSVADVALAYMAIAGPDASDHTTLLQPPAHISGLGNRDVKKIRIGIFAEHFNDGDAAVVAACKAIVDKLEKMGVRVVPISIPNLDVMKSAHGITILSEMATTLDKYYTLHAKDLSPDTRTSLGLARSFSSRDFIAAQQVRGYGMGVFEAIFEDVDVIVSPTLPITAPKIDESLKFGASNMQLTTAIMRHQFVGNLLGLPALTVPVGYVNKLPVGIQLMGNHWSEALLLQLGFVIEQQVAPAKKQPVRFYKVLDTEA